MNVCLLSVCTETVRADIAFVVDGSGSICDIDTTWDRQEPICNNWRTVSDNREYL